MAYKKYQNYRFTKGAKSNISLSKLLQSTADKSPHNTLDIDNLLEIEAITHAPFPNITRTARLLGITILH